MGRRDEPRHAATRNVMVGRDKTPYDNPAAKNIKDRIRQERTGAEENRGPEKTSTNKTGQARAIQYRKREGDVELANKGQATTVKAGARHGATSKNETGEKQHTLGRNLHDK